MSRLAILGYLGVPIVVVALLLPGLAVGPSFDAAVFSTVGWRVIEGDALYAAVWDHKPPGAYLPYAAAHAVSSDPNVAWAIVWCLTGVCIAGAMLLIGAVLRRAGAGVGPSAIAAAFGAFGAGAYLLSLGGGLSESFAILPLAGAILAATRGRWLMTGIAAGLAVAVSLQSLPVLAAITVLAMGGQASSRAARIAAGIGVVALIAAVGLWWNGALAAAPDALLGYSAAYRAVTAREGGGSPWALVPWAILVLLPLLLGIGLALIRRRGLVDRRLAIASAVWMVVGVLLIAVQGRFYAHYATPLVLPATILTGLGLHAAVTSLRRARVLLGVPVVLTLGLALVAGAAGAADEQAPFRASNERAATVGAEVSRLTESDESILVWGNAARVYELARRAPATRYVYLYPLLTPGYVTDARISRVLAELEAASPAAVVDAGSLEPGAPGLPPLLIDRPLATDGRDTDLLDPLRRYVEARSLPAETVAGWPIYLAR